MSIRIDYGIEVDCLPPSGQRQVHRHSIPTLEAAVSALGEWRRSDARFGLDRHPSLVQRTVTFADWQPVPEGGER